MTDFRALCAELVNKLEEWVAFGDVGEIELAHALIDRARAALAQPEPQGPGPTDEELYDYWISTSPEFGCADPVGFSRAVLARWGRPAQPEPQVIGSEWRPCVKLPITVHVREQRPGETHVSTREGITPVRPDDLIMRGVQGEEYPIGRELFNQTYKLEQTDD